MKSVVMVCRAWIARAYWMPGISRIPWMSVVAAVRAVVTVVAWTVVTVVAWTVVTVVAWTVITVVAWTVMTVVAWTVITVVVRSVVMLVVRTVMTVVSWLSLRIAVGTASSAGVSGGCSSAVAGVLCYHIGCRHR